VQGVQSSVDRSAGHAIQYMNLMFGFEERQRLEGAALFPEIEIGNPS